MTINNQFIEEYAYIVETIVKQYHYPQIKEDLMQEGYIGLMEAGRKYEPACGVTFESYAAWWIQKYVKKGVQQYAYLMCMPTHPKKGYLQEASISYDQPLYAEDGDIITLADVLSDGIDMEEILNRRMIRDEMLKALTDQERQIVQYCYGIDVKQLSTIEIADEMGLNIWTVHKKIERAIEKMQKKSQWMSKNA